MTGEGGEEEEEEEEGLVLKHSLRLYIRTYSETQDRRGTVPAGPTSGRPHTRAVPQPAGWSDARRTTRQH